MSAVPTDNSYDTIVADLTELSIEQLMDIEVTVASKKRQKLSDVASAIFVITQDDIRRSGVTSIPEALRMVPGVHVARLDKNKWAISARGFNDRFSNKLLVLMDGRSVYTPLFSGVFWHMQDTLIEDIDRIEVIRGPGASVWGANAVNGVINIITKNASETQGGLVTSGIGTEEKFGGVRFGGQSGPDLSYRVYAKATQYDTGEDPSGGDGNDDWESFRTGFRLDGTCSPTDSYTLQGDAHFSEVSEKAQLFTLTPPYSRIVDNTSDNSGANLLGRWKHTISDDSQATLQAYFDRSVYKSIIVEEVRHTFDLELQHQLRLLNRHDIIWGLGFRYTFDRIDGTEFAMGNPSSRHDTLYSAFIQDEITLIPDTLKLTLGTKFEHNDYTGSEIQPSGRLLWSPHERHTFWGAISRAVRTPSRAEHDGRFRESVIPPGGLFPGSPLVEVIGLGDSGVRSEELIAYEMGYRTWIIDQLTLDIAGFYNDYDHLLTAENGGTSLILAPPPRLQQTFFGSSNQVGRSYGVEVSADWQALDWWRFRTAYTFEQINLRIQSNSDDTFSDTLEDRTPHHQISIRSLMDLSPTVELDLWFRYVDDLPEVNVEAYSTLDVRLGWKPRPDLELAIVGQNLLQQSHLEYDEPQLINTFATEVEASVYGKVAWRF